MMRLKFRSERTDEKGDSRSWMWIFHAIFYQDGLPASPEVSPLVLSNDGKGESRIEVAHVTAQLSSIIPIANQEAVPNLTNIKECSIRI